MLSQWDSVPMSHIALYWRVLRLLFWIFSICNECLNGHRSLGTLFESVCWMSLSFCWSGHIFSSPWSSKANVICANLSDMTGDTVHVDHVDHVDHVHHVHHGGPPCPPWGGHRRQGWVTLETVGEERLRDLMEAAYRGARKIWSWGRRGNVTNVTNIQVKDVQEFW